MSYHAESFEVEPMVQKVRKNLKACAIAMKSSIERDVKAKVEAVPSGLL
jgi:hypothetical protein